MESLSHCLLFYLTLICISPHCCKSNYLFQGIKQHSPGFCHRNSCRFCFNPFALRALPPYRRTVQGEKAKYILSHRQKSHIKEVLKTPPLCFVMQNIGEVAHSDGGVENRPSSADLYWTFNPLARWALPLYRCAAQGERFESVTSNI